VFQHAVLHSGARGFWTRRPADSRLTQSFPFPFFVRVALTEMGQHAGAVQPFTYAMGCNAIRSARGGHSRHSPPLTRGAVMRRRVRVNVTATFGGSPRTIRGHIGERLLTTLKRHGYHLEGACGGNMDCGTCHVYIDRKWRLALVAPSGPSPC